MLVDAHCHLIGSNLNNNRLSEMLDRARQSGVGGFIAVGTDLADSPQVLELARTHHDIRASVGIHPHEAKTWTDQSLDALRELASAPEVLFIGETGLDWHYDFSPREEQELVFRAQVRLAVELGKPLMIHTRTSREATLAVLREEGGAVVGGMFHCYSEDLAFAREVLDLGFHISFSGLVTFPKAPEIQAVAAWAPADRILVETDSPYLAPVPYRGKRNEPAHVTHVAAFVAKLRGISPEALAEQTTSNLEALCGWPRRS